MSVQSLIADLLPVSPSSPPMAKAASHVPPAKAANLAKTRVVAESAPVAKAANPWLKMAKTPSAPPGEDPVLATFSHASPDFSQAESRVVTGGLATLAALAGDGCANDSRTDPIPLATATRAEVEAWMDAVGETNPETRREILIGYGFDPDFQYPDSGRRTCRQCANLDADGGCRAARRGQIPNASRHYTWPNGIDDPHRCVGFLEGRP